MDIAKKTIRSGVNSAKYRLSQQSFRTHNLMTLVYANHQTAKEKIQFRIDKKGIDIALKVLVRVPDAFGKLKGKSFLGHPNAKRQDAMVLVKELKFCLEKEHILKIELEQTQRIEALQVARYGADKNRSAERS